VWAGQALQALGQLAHRTGGLDVLAVQLTAALALSEKNRTLESDLAAAKRDYGQLKSQLDERASYLLKEVRPGAFAYALKDPGAAGQPAHYLCQACYDSGVKVVLQLSDNRLQLLCSNNTAHRVRIADDPPYHWEQSAARGRPL
jgi:hypothetical protein